MKYVGRLIKTSIGNLKIKKAKYVSLGAGPDMEVIKNVSIKTKCGHYFMLSENQLAKTLVKESE
jgi:hypothetical protein